LRRVAGSSDSHDDPLDAISGDTTSPRSGLAAVGTPPAVGTASPATSRVSGDTAGKLLTNRAVGSPATLRDGSKTMPGNSRRPNGFVSAERSGPFGSAVTSIRPSR